jgi:hypothetical protein
MRRFLAGMSACLQVGRPAALPDGGRMRNAGIGRPEFLVTPVTADING